MLKTQLRERATYIGSSDAKVSPLATLNNGKHCAQTW